VGAWNKQMKIDTISGWYRGVGDILCYAWMGEA
jgi:hypothetical protein